MTRIKTHYVCQQCGYLSGKWLGRCPECGEWNSLVEEAGKAKPVAQIVGASPLIPITEVECQDSYRLTTGIDEFDRVLGGGLVPGSLVLIGGDPGIGKSTLLLQTASMIAQQGIKVLYLSAEESARQIRLRAERLQAVKPEIILVNTQAIDNIPDLLKQVEPGLVIIDSIQTVYSENITSAPGSVSQLRGAAAFLMRLAKESEIPFVLIGHVTKEGYLAGPRVLEHLVDTVVYFEGEKNYAYRVLRAVKNRFGSTDEMGILEMTAAGLTGVGNPSLLLMGEHHASLPGCVLTSSMEGSRPLVLELQALVASATAGYPRRMALGMDNSRLSLMLAVLEKHVRRDIAALDVYARITGGIYVRDPAIDLGLAAAILSSYNNLTCPRDTIYIGEVGLTGEVRSVPFMEARLKEAASLGITRAVVPIALVEDGRALTMPIKVEAITSIMELIN
ncbi:MAG: DNA repair protein RadA [Methanomassiliicoccales archaeon]